MELFDKEKEQQRQREAQLIGQIGSQGGDIARTQGQIEATKAANEKMAGATQQDRDQARADWMKANPGKTPSDGDITGQVYQNFYHQAFTESGFGTGGKVQPGYPGGHCGGTEASGWRPGEGRCGWSQSVSGGSDP